MKESKTCQYEVIGNLDADISFEPDHFEFLLQEILRGPTPRCSRNSLQKRKATVRKQTASRGTSTFRGSASCSGGSAGRKSAVTSHTAPEESTGWR